MSLKEKLKEKSDKYLKNFFFFTLKTQSNFKKLKQEMGEIDTVTLIEAKGELILRAKNSLHSADSLFTQEERKKMHKLLKVDKETIEESQSIFVMLHMENHSIHVRQKKKNGEIREKTI